MRRHGEAFVGIDTAKARNAVAVAEGGREGELRYVGEFANTPDAVAKLVRKLAERYETLQFCYEAGPTGYGLHRQLLALGQNCIVVAPSLIPRRPGDRVKTGSVANCDDGRSSSHGLFERCPLGCFKFHPFADELNGSVVLSS